MSSASVIGSLVLLGSLVVFDIFCADLTNVKLSSDNSLQRSTTPWPAVKDRWTIKPRPENDLRHPPKGTAPKWIQQNNIWIRNEQEVYNSQFEDDTRPSTPRNIHIHLTSTTPKNTQRESNSNRNNHRNQNVPQLNVTTPRYTQNIQREQNSNRNNYRNQNVPQFSDTTPKNTKIWGHNIPTNSRKNVENDFPALSTPKSQSETKSERPAPSRQNSWADVVNGGGRNSVSTTEKYVPSTPTKGSNKESTDTQFDSNVENLQVNDSPVTDDELREFSETLLKRDVNNAAKYVNINLQAMTTSRNEEDKAPEPLLQIDPQAYKIPSIEKIILLYNNYFLDSSQNEVHTGAERIEENDLLDAVINTPVMQYARTFLMQKGKIGKDPKEFRDLLKLIWFNMYSRGQGRIGSSGFEHVFVAELKNNQVSGLHNWLYFNEEEKNNRANYLGYMKKLDLGNKGAILKYHFTFHDVDKPVGSMFIGTSPELEMALYSTCFLLRADRICPLKMNDNRFIIRTYSYRYRGKNMIGSAFPEI